MKNPVTPYREFNIELLSQQLQRATSERTGHHVSRAEIEALIADAFTAGKLAWERGNNRIMHRDDWPAYRVAVVANLLQLVKQGVLG